MKKLILLSCVLQLHASIISLKIPQSLLSSDSSLMLYLQNYDGQKLIGTCPLQDMVFQRVISEKALSLKSLEQSDAGQVLNAVNLVDLSQAQDANAVVIVEFLFDREVQMLKAFIVKSEVYDASVNLSDAETVILAENHHSFKEFEDDDLLEGLTNFAEQLSADSDVDAAQQEKNGFTFKQYILLAELFLVMQYGKVKRTISSWL